MKSIDLRDQRVIVREDLNVPMHDGDITNDVRIQRALPTLKAAQSQGARVLVLSHLGRPEEGVYDAQYSLAPVAARLSELLKTPVRLVDDWLDGVEINPGEIALAENIRFLKGEKANNTILAQRMARQCDVFVMDAFATAHRAQASTAGIAEYAPIACAGPLMEAELTALSQALDHPKKPLVAIVGGSKVSTKIQLLDALLDKVDVLIVGGGIANTFLAAKGLPIGKSLYEADWVERAKNVLDKAEQKGVHIPLPTDVAVAKTFSADADARYCDVSAVAEDEMILDVGPQTAATFAPLLKEAGTIVWNGPVGVFEFAPFSQGTRALAKAVANSAAYSIAGGGDTLAALDVFDVADDISYVSTGGGAFLAYLQGNTLPAVAVLQKRTLTKKEKI